MSVKHNFSKGQIPGHLWSNKVGRLLSDIWCNRPDVLEIRERADGMGLEALLNLRALLDDPNDIPPGLILTHPWKVTVAGTGASATYSCTGGRVWTREGNKLDVAAVSDETLTETCTVICEVTIPDGGGTPSAEIKLVVGAVDYWVHAASSGVVKSFPLALITVTDGVPAVTQVRLSDIDAGAGTNVNDDATSDLQDSAGTDFVVLTADGATNTRDAKLRALTAQIDHGRMIRWQWGAPVSAGVYAQPTDGQGGHRTFCVHATTDSWDEVLDDTIDWRNRIVQSWIATHGTAAADPTADSRYTGRTGSAENLVSDGAYQLYVASDGKLRCSAPTATVAGRLIHVLVSGAQCAPYGCPCPSFPPAAWPCNGLVEEYEVEFTLRIRRYAELDTDCSGTAECDETVSESVVLTAQTAGGGCVWFGTALTEACGIGLGAAVLSLNTTNGQWEISLALGSLVLVKASGLTPAGGYSGDSASCFQETILGVGTRYLVVDVTNVLVAEVAP